MEVVRFERCAKQRFEEAEYLLRETPYYTAAMYLGGYAVECILKALIFTLVRPKDVASVLDGFRQRGSRAHNYVLLYEAYHEKRRGPAFPAEVVEALTYTSSWSTDLRYEPGCRPLTEVQGFLAAAERIIQFVARRIH